MRCVVILCLFVIAVAVGYPQRPLQYGSPLYPQHQPFYTPFLHAGAGAGGQETRRHRDLDDDQESVFARPEFDLSDLDTPPYLSQASPFSDMMTQMQAMMIRLKQEMNEILRRLPSSTDLGGEGGDVDGAILPFAGDGLDLSNAQNKTTSKTEIIDGQVYTINETVIKTGNNDAGSIIRVKTIRVSPTETPLVDEQEHEHDSSTVRDYSTEQSAEAEVSPPSVSRRSKNDDNNDIPNEKMPIAYRYAGDAHAQDTAPHPPPTDSVHEQSISNQIDGNSVEDYVSTDMAADKPRDLSRDLAVNDIMQAQTKKRGNIMMLPSDVELIGIDQPTQNHYYKYDFGVDQQSPDQHYYQTQWSRAEPVETVDDTVLADQPQLDYLP